MKIKYPCGTEIFIYLPWTYSKRSFQKLAHKSVDGRTLEIYGTTHPINAAQHIFGFDQRELWATTKLPNGGPHRLLIGNST